MTNDTITIESKRAVLSSELKKHEVSVTDFSQKLAENVTQGLWDEPNPCGSRWVMKHGPLKVVIMEFSPAVRMIRWIADESPEPFGPEAKMLERQLAMPYVILKIPIRSGRVLPRVELFYRSEPLRSLDGPGGELFWPNLLNVSPDSHGCKAWFCTQYLDGEDTHGGVEAAVEAVTHHCFGGQHNLSSEAHEGNSTFRLAQQQDLDSRITDVTHWETATRHDPFFVLSVDWQSTGLTVGDLLRSELSANRLKRVPQTVKDLVSIMLRRTRPR